MEKVSSAVDLIKTASNKIVKTHDAFPTLTINEIDSLRRFTDSFYTFTTSSPLPTLNTKTPDVESNVLNQYTQYNSKILSLQIYHIELLSNSKY
uniref:Uncharacterized protein n=1 Tax=Strongyloides venezuelensis TaxID=75913 RepID=A0A0K0G328_STRVS